MVQVALPAWPIDRAGARDFDGKEQGTMLVEVIEAESTDSKGHWFKSLCAGLRQPPQVVDDLRRWCPACKGLQVSLL